MSQVSRPATNAVVVGAVLLSVGLIAVSATLNFRMAYRMGDSTLDGWVYGGGAATADILKALLPLCIWWAWRRRQLVAALAGAVLLLVFAAYSFTASVGYASQLRSFQEEERLHAAEERTGLVREIGWLEQRLEKLGPQRGEREIAAEIDLMLAKPLGKSSLGVASENCKILGRWSRAPCEKVAELRQELARSAEAEETAAALHKARTNLAALGSVGATGGADPQVAALAGMVQRAGWPVEQTDVRLALLLLVGALFELGSGLGLYVATVPWRSAQPSFVTEARPVGEVEQFVLERLEPRQGEGLTVLSLFQHYASWCQARGEAPLLGPAFSEGFAQIARECGLRARGRGDNRKYLNLGLSKKGTDVTNLRALANSTS